MFLCVFVGTLIGCSNEHATVKQRIDQANYVRVYLPSSGISLDMNLSTKQWYGYKWAVKDDIAYTYNGNFRADWLSFNYFKKINLLYPIVADKTTISKVRKSNYLIVKEVRNNSNQKEIIDIWHDNGHKGNKMKVFYNHACLPIKVQMLDADTNKWKTIVKYSYPNLTQKKYERNWKNHVKEIKDGEYID
ncbi:hypothetical protein [Lactobacillus sp. PV034]|uniref:hypothetical protein n=1 Tax=Lactobacillus sp. PV034 TaxID=2594495 RepID=UPI002240D0C6|nr:hypothetical protein [Lactobacillus sp. PV034]QNQ80631.1 hypothetical protein FP432_03230 [Lactobacillus sp. PV034]